MFVGGDAHGAGPVMKDLWENDKRNIKHEYEKDQKENCKHNMHATYRELDVWMNVIATMLEYYAQCMRSTYIDDRF